MRERERERERERVAGERRCVWFNDGRVARGECIEVKRDR